jgi:hypothetical protein
MKLEAENHANLVFSTNLRNQGKKDEIREIECPTGNTFFF